MKLSVFLLAGWISLLSCTSNEKAKTKPQDYFTPGQTRSLLYQIVQKTARKPEGNPTSSEKEAWYQEQLKTYQWHYALSDGGTGFYYFISRPAPSLYGKRMGLGGYFTSPDHMNILGFKEVFQTYKMKPDELQERGAILFEKMTLGEDLAPFMANRGENPQGWIEFPDGLVAYDSLQQKWVIEEK